MSSSNLPVLLIAGGRSRRMGVDKAQIVRPDGLRQIDYLAGLARATGGPVFLSLAPGAEDPVNLPVIADTHAGAGPVAALAAFASARPGQPVFAIACDLFLLRQEDLAHLIAHRDPQHAATCFANRIDGKAEPLCTIYEPEALARAAAWIDAGEHCARKFLRSLDPAVLELPRPAALDNTNTPHDLRETLAKLTCGITAKDVRVLYFAKLREERGLSEETVTTLACTAAGLYDELSFRHRLSLDPESLRAARNGDFCPWDEPLSPGDEIVFIPPVAGG